MKFYVVTLAFAPMRILKEGILNCKATSNLRPEMHVLLDNHYPLKREGEITPKELAERHYLTYVDPGQNLGLHHGFNRACDSFRDVIQDEDAVICFDADSTPTNCGWGYAMQRVMENDQDVQVLGLMNPYVVPEIKARGHTTHMTASAFYLKAQNVCMISVAAWRWSFLKHAGGFQEPTNYYGHLESAMWEKLKTHGGSWAYLRDFKEDNHLQAEHDPEYTQYKIAHAHEHSFSGSFAEYLKAKGKL